MSQPSSRAGILAGGNWIVDHVKVLDSWPPQDALATILSETSGNGGSPYNILKNLAKLGADFPRAGVGLLGNDSDGELILADCRVHGINVDALRQTAAASTAYSDVMTESATGRRTFFHQRGANALLAPDHFDFAHSTAKIFHLGYLLLLDSLDKIENGQPLALHVLKRARSEGMLTSLDCVSENSDRFNAVIKPVLPEVDFLFVNDFEAEKLTGISLAPDSSPGKRRRAVEAAADALLGMGVRQWAIIHLPEAAYSAGRGQRSYWQPSLNVPAQAIKGAAGAGDAFASGVLFGLHAEWAIADCMRLGVCAAASSLTDASCSEGVSPYLACLALDQTFGWRPQFT